MGNGKSRLNLDFSITTAEGRNRFIEDYLAKIDFTPNREELGKIGDYLIWGTDNNGQNFDDVELPSKKGTWKKKIPESLDALMEKPTFNENNLRAKEEPAQKIPRKKIEREFVRKNAPDHVREQFEVLWRQIDEIEVMIGFYDLARNKRSKELREKLVERFSELELGKLRADGEKLEQHKYLKLRHLLVELRTQQYTLMDSFSSTMQNHGVAHYQREEVLDFGEEICVLPLGIARGGLWEKVFREDRYPIPKDFRVDELEEISRYLWEEKEKWKYSLDLENPQHWLKILGQYDDMRATMESKVDVESNLAAFARTIEFYAARANLDPMHREILEMKIAHLGNSEIAEKINAKYAKKYNMNYISTLFCQKIVGELVKAVTMHREIVENLFFEENFKVCKDCGGVFLLDERNWVRKSRSSDGFSPRCKSCEKILRERRKQK